MAVDSDIGADRAPARLRRGWIVLAIALLLGLLSFVAIRSIRIDCRDVALATDAGGPLTTDAGEPLTTGQRSCRFTY
jgi:hypothetical protein